MSDIKELSGGGIPSLAAVPAAPVAAVVTGDFARQRVGQGGDSMPDDGDRSPRSAPPERLDRAVEQLNHYVQSVRRELHFSIDEASGQTVVTVLDPETDQVIRQIPSVEALLMAAQIEQGESPRSGMLMLGEA